MKRICTTNGLSVAVWISAVAAFVGGCSPEAQGGRRRAPPDAVPEAVRVAGAVVELGVKLGASRSKVENSSFSISRLPTTVAQFKRCVDAGACRAPELASGACAQADRGVDGATYAAATSDAAAKRTPMTCIREAEAATFCEWVGGRLPRVDEWLLAARGPKVARFSWGDAQPDCTRHWRTTFEDSVACQPAASPLELGALDAHQAGTSSAGVADVLATQGELMKPLRDARVLGCLPTAKGCIVSGLTPGAIDSIGQREGVVWGFRCVWEER